MSTLVDDKKPVQEGRRQALKGAEAPLRDRIVAKLFDRLVEDDFAIKMVSAWETGNAERGKKAARMGEWLSSWDEHLIREDNTEGAGSSNLHIPMPFIVVKTMHARFFAAVLGQDPPFSVKARNSAFQDRVTTVADTLRYAVMDWSNYNKGVEATVDQWIWDWLTIGSGRMKWRWDCKYSRFIDVQQVAKKGAPKIVVDPATGKEAMVPTTKMVEQEVAVTKKVFEGPVLENIHWEDMLTVGGNGDPDLADLVIHRQWLTASELWTLVDRKIFDREAVERVIAGGANGQSGATGSQLKDQRALNAGQVSSDTNIDLDRYEILECYTAWACDESGINAEVVGWVHTKSRELLRATYLYRLSPTGERPFVKADFHRRADQEDGVGLVELLYPLSVELDAHHNMRVDFGLMSTMPFGFYRATSGIDPEIINYKPGTLIPVDNPQADVFFPNLGNRTSFGMQEEAALQQMVERLTGINDMQLGMLAGQGAARTATGARAVMGESSSNLDVHLRRLNRGWKKALRYLLSQLQKRLPTGLAFRITGEDGQDYWREVKDAAYIHGEYDIEVSPLSSTSNQSIQQEQAQMLLQLTSNPLDIQLGIVTANNRYQAMKNVLKAAGIRDFGRYITMPDPSFEQARLTPEEEANRILHGLEVPVVPQADHQGFINFVQMFHDNDELMGQFQPEQIIRLERQAQKHQQMLQAMQAAQAQAANAQQMQMNASMSSQQAPLAVAPISGINQAVPTAPGMNE